MVEVPFGSGVLRLMDSGPALNHITMYGIRFTRNPFYTKRLIAVGPFTLQPAATKDIPAYVEFSDAIESFVDRLALTFENLSPEKANVHRTHIGEKACPFCIYRQWPVSFQQCLFLVNLC
jgi:hypothetical protein